MLKARRRQSAALDARHASPLARRTTGKRRGATIGANAQWPPPTKRAARSGGNALGLRPTGDDRAALISFQRHTQLPDAARWPAEQTNPNQPPPPPPRPRGAVPDGARGSLLLHLLRVRIGYDGADPGVPHARPEYVPRLQRVEHDDGDVVLLAQRDGGLVHHLEPLKRHAAV